MPGPPQLPAVNRALYNQGINKNANARGGRRVVPELIQCAVCMKNKTHDGYSTRQLNNYKATGHSTYAPGGRVKAESKTTCKQCTPGQTTELTCIVCGETSGLKSFAKAQRKYPDNARCKKCINMQADTAPDLEVPDSDEYVSSDDDDQLDVDFDTGLPIVRGANRNLGPAKQNNRSGNDTGLTTEKLRQLNINQDYASVAKDDDGDDDDDDDDEDGWVDQTPAKKPPPPSTFTYGTAPSKRDYRAPSPPLPHVKVAQDKKNGWARPDKIHKKVEPNPKQARQQNYRHKYDGEGSDDDAQRNGGWAEPKNSQNPAQEADPWARVYK